MAERITQLKAEIANADAVIIGAGAGLFLFMICRRIVGGKAAHVSALCATLPTAVLSAALYVRGSPQTLFEALPLLPFAAAGGALGAYLMSRLRVRALGYITAALAVTGGVFLMPMENRM